MKKLFIIVITSLSMFSIVHADNAMPTGKTFSPEFNKLKSLAGNWRGQKEMQGKKVTVDLNYKVSSAGSAVVETIFKGAPHEMVTVYTEVEGKIHMTHYCALQNQPSLTLKKSTPTTLDFDYTSGNNLDPAKDAHMHHLKLIFKDKNTIEQQWTQFKNGKSDETSSFIFARAD